MRLELAQSAMSDLLAIKAWYLEQGVPHIGQRFITDILAAAQRLTAQPDSGRIVPEFNQANIREIILPPFRMVYLREADCISLARVWRSERLLQLP
ncbi:plasmid stabilization system protein ParE [Rheinheimera pacifica]|uniref:type II toxin-antitoxin system RelE/ParE family toxin n=1 Tax=Rheinheimera pacifica TaxID=173990 RepID=UPI002168AFAF|nr:type II toxin-antitoxin system RelE/ParE family toxin [Rheinheimera pacifica]MCS4306587.1 plasmid stabilization system protein ParE [Rheinheimera pacifica]